MRSRTAWVLALTAAVLALAPDPVWAQGCAMCKTALTQSEEGKILAASLRSGILFLLGAPYAILATIAYVVFRAYRKRKQAA